MNQWLNDSCLVIPTLFRHWNPQKRTPLTISEVFLFNLCITEWTLVHALSMLSMCMCVSVGVRLSANMRSHLLRTPQSPNCCSAVIIHLYLLSMNFVGVCVHSPVICYQNFVATSMSTGRWSDERQFVMLLRTPFRHIHASLFIGIRNCSHAQLMLSN